MMLLSLSPIAFLSLAMLLAINVVVAQSQYSLNPFKTSLAQHEAKSLLKWCGKCYQKQDIGNPACELGKDTYFQSIYPAERLPEVRITCTTRLSAYEKEELDVDIEIEVLVSTYSDKPFQDELPLSIVNHAGKTVFTGYIKTPSKDFRVPIPASLLTDTAHKTSFQCLLQPGKHPRHSQLVSHATVSVLPKLKAGSQSRIDYLTGALQARSAHSPSWHPFLPFGWYCTWDRLRDGQADEVLSHMKSLGLTMIHPVPDRDFLLAESSSYRQLLDTAHKLGLWVVYDFRWTFQNASSVAEQVELVKDHPAILLWYTGDEPDGKDPPEPQVTAYDVIKATDRGAHPVLLVLTCRDYSFDKYARGTDILATDAYPVSVNTAFSRLWNTTCTETFGDCGCDGCTGHNNLSDPTMRVEIYRERLEVMSSSQGHGRRSLVNAKMPLWSVPQGFPGPEEYWPREPTPAELSVMALGSVARGASAVMPWQWRGPSLHLRQEGSKLIVAALKVISKHLLQEDGHGTRLYGLIIHSSHGGGIDAGGWRLSNGHSLVLIANPGFGRGYHDQDFTIGGLNHKADAHSNKVLWTSTGRHLEVEWQNGMLSGHLEPLEVAIILLG